MIDQPMEEKSRKKLELELVLLNTTKNLLELRIAQLEEDKASLQQGIADVEKKLELALLSEEQK